MKLKKNIFKSIITSIFGILVMATTIILVLGGVMDWVWNGIGGIFVGAVLLLSPDKIVKWVPELFSKFTGKTFNNSAEPQNIEQVDTKNT